MSSYKVLNKQKFSQEEFSIVPIRRADRYKIMNWRNEQVYHLRQDGQLSKGDQDAYFDSVVSKLFDQSNPRQLLFSYLKDNVCIGYGGLVHINWVDKNAEISFIVNTSLEENEFNKHWTTYLSMIEQVAFDELKFRKLFVYAFDLRPHLYEVLEQNKYFEDARLIEHCLYNEEFIDVVIHAKINRSL